MLALDQIVKLWARYSLVEGQSMHWPLPGIFELTLTYNKGIAFGLFQGFGVALAPVAVAIAAGAIWYAHKHPRDSMWHLAAAALLAAGALGNLYDRLMLGKVTDMFWVRAINFPVFNVADSCITVAAAILIVKWGRDAVSGETHHETPSEAEEEEVEAQTSQFSASEGNPSETLSR
jgi:signal peptidase II